MLAKFVVNGIRFEFTNFTYTIFGLSIGVVLILTLLAYLSNRLKFKLINQDNSAVYYHKIFNKLIVFCVVPCVIFGSFCSVNLYNKEQNIAYMFSIGLLTISFLCTFIVPFANTVIFIKDGYLVSKTLLYTKNINLKEKFVCNKDKVHSNSTTMI